MLMDVESYAAWESSAIALLAKPAEPEVALARLAVITERVRQWQPAGRSRSDVGRGFSPAETERLLHSVQEAFAQTPAPIDRSAPAGIHGDLDDVVVCRLYFELTRDCVPSGLTVPDVPTSWAETDARLVAPAWDEFSPVLRRYLAGRLFGSWVAYQGRGLRTVVASLACALSVVRIEAVRECLKSRRMLDRSLLMSAIRRADLLLVHNADRQELATRLSRVERAPFFILPSSRS